MTLDDHSEEDAPGCTWSYRAYLIIIQHITICNVTLKQICSYKYLHHWLPSLHARSSILSCVSAEQYSKTGRTKPKSICQEAIYRGILASTSSTYQVFEKLLWKPSKDVSQWSSWSQISLLMYGHQNPSAQFCQ